MKKLLIPAIVLILAGAALVSAQEGPRLRQPSGEEVLAAIANAGQAIRAQSEHLGTREEMLFAHLSSLVLHQYGATDANSTVWLDAYAGLGASRSNFIPRDDWLQILVAAWLRENAVDLNAVSELQFADVTITVTPRDFDGDGAPEFVLDAMKGARIDRQGCAFNQIEIADYFVVQQTIAGYQFFETGLFWHGRPAGAPFRIGDGGLAEQRFADVNADGLPEWILQEGGVTGGGPQLGYVNSGQLYALAWRDGGLVDLLPYDEYSHSLAGYNEDYTLCEGPRSLTVTWDFTDIDGDPPLELLQAQRYEDNWRCTRTETKVFDWSPADDGYLYLETRIVLDDTQHCAQRQAEEALWAGDVAAAIPLYERALTLPTLPPGETDEPAQAPALGQYLRVRLTLAYLLAGRDEEAAPLLDALAAEEPADEAVGALGAVLQEAQAAGFSPLQTCAAAYTVMATTFPEVWIGFTTDAPYYDAIRRYTPALAGCDAPAMLDAALAEATLSTAKTPPEHLAALGIETRESLALDLDGDGQDEWLVWAELPGVQRFFAPEGEVYRVSTPDLNPFRPADALTAVPLPDDAGIAIAVLDSPPDWTREYRAPWICVFDPICGIYGPDISCPHPDGTYHRPLPLDLWGLRDGELQHIFTRSLTCEQSLDGLFPGGEQGRALILSVPAYDASTNETFIRDETYTWDAAQMTYVSPATPTPVVTPTPAPEATRTPEQDRQYPPYDAYLEGDYPTVLDHTPQEFALLPDDSLYDILGGYYLRALSLEALDRPDEALALYVAIRDAAPTNPWGVLAGLHVEE